MRRPAVAGRFYPADPHTCCSAADELLSGLPRADAIGAVVPHAGWIFSGRTAARSVASIADQSLDTVVIFGAVHVRDRNLASLYATGTWETPLGTVAIDEELCRSIAQSLLVTVDRSPHASEHSIEVEIPLIQAALPAVRVVPLMVNPTIHAAEVGVWVARCAQKLGRRVAFLGSTDLTHYGAVFGFEPAGHGPGGVRWAKEYNDRRFIGRIADLEADELVRESTNHRNACGGGAAAAMLAACVEFGGRSAIEAEHTTSAEVSRERWPTDSVGYVSMSFHR